MREGQLGLRLLIWTADRFDLSIDALYAWRAVRVIVRLADRLI